MHVYAKSDLQGGTILIPVALPQPQLNITRQSYTLNI